MDQMKKALKKQKKNKTPFKETENNTSSKTQPRQWDNSENKTHLQKHKIGK